jgi:hypothetical protein
MEDDMDIALEDFGMGLLDLIDEANKEATK